MVVKMAFMEDETVKPDGKKFDVRNLVLTGMFVALGILYAFVLHAIFSETAGSAFAPMHITVLLCGFVCGRRYGAVCGALTPALSFWILGMPPLFLLFPMMFELAAYGYLSGLAVRYIHPVTALVAAMLGGRAMFGFACWGFFGVIAPPFGSFTFGWFLTASFVTSLPAIITQIIGVPAILFALQKARVAHFPTFRVKRENNNTCD